MSRVIRPLRSILLLSGVLAVLLPAGGCGGSGEADDEAARAEGGTPPAAVEEAEEVAPAPAPARPPAEPAADGDARYRPAPDFTLPVVGGGELTLSDLRGKVVLLDFWATWCGPCRRGIPHLNELYAAHREKGLEVIGISVDRPQRGQTPEQLVTGFMERLPMSYPNVLADQGGSVQRAYGGIRSIPTAFLLDRDGRIRRHYVGLQPPDVFERDIRELLAEPAPEDAESI